MREYISPNWHAVLIHAPLGLLSVGIVLELMGFLWRRSGLRPAARWMILIGAVTCVPALTSGIYAYRDVISPNTSGDVTFDDTWNPKTSNSEDGLLDGTIKDRTGILKDHRGEIVNVKVSEWLASRPGQLLRNHIIFNATGVGLVFLVVVLWIACSDTWRRRLYLPLLLLLILGKGALIYGSHDAGQAVYVHAVAVEPANPPPDAGMALTRHQQLKQALPPAQLHFTMAGWVFAISLVALALSIRAITQPELTAADETWFQTPDANGDEPGLPAPAGTALGIETSAAGSAFDPIADDPTTVPLTEQRRVLVRSSAPGVSRVVIAPAAASVQLPNSRFWLLATAFGLVTLASGLWIIGFWTWTNKWQDLKDVFRGEPRNLYHAIIGSSIVVLTLLLSILTRIARRNKLLLSIFATLLFLCIAAQVWLGILLTFDGPKGPLNKYSVPKEKKVVAMVMPAHSPFALSLPPA